MRVATFLLCVLVTVSVSVVESNGNETGASQFLKCEACVLSLSKPRDCLEGNGNLTALTTLKETIRFNTPLFWEVFIDKTDDDKLIRFIINQLDKVQALCGVTGTKDNLTCTRDPTGGRLLLQLLVDSIMKEFQVFHHGAHDFHLAKLMSCEKCITDVEDLRALLQTRDAQDELKEYAEAACKAVWNYWSGAGSDADWCKEGIDRHWNEIVQIILSAVADPGHVCSVMRSECMRPGRRGFNHVATPYLGKAGGRLYNDCVDGIQRCVRCIGGKYRLKEAFLESCEGGFLGDVKNSVAQLFCNLWTDDEVESCLKQVDGQLEMIKRNVVDLYCKLDCNTEQYGFYGRSIALCTNEDHAKLKIMSISHKNRLLCESCKSTLSAVKEELKKEELGKELDRLLARKIFGKSFEGIFGSNSFAELVEYINEEDQCTAMKMCSSVGNATC